ncbi:Gfo/Idh/MocA family protein [Oceanobacillus profundus]|uniref:Gfo/Idh/MocA family oxidoreductase n=1 Tax=Oceanobacillus profundus TaxID=372463 RepID=A0A417YAI3_9BACI|nr:Gfo/Idh/MocA family oxidoreductase [Oceanobacillus profundus]PAE28762.1 dehydrogenase [Paenibacillus sp. 7884-2]RHW29702.1 gfo/Idh/MocA family oxidoreductase [Oceanobacillus profundus]
MKQKEIRIGMIGYQFMGKAHSHAYRDLPFFFNTKIKPVQKAIAGRNESAVKEAAEKMGWESYETDWRRLVERDDIDVIDIVTPNHTHAEIAIAAAEAGKHIITEKPLALTLEEAHQMYEAVQKNGVTHMICHNYRFAPAVQFTKKLIEAGRLGRIYHFRANYLQDFIMDPQFPLVWRLKKEVSGTGALGDIGAHSIDLARFLVGEFKEVVSIMETFIKERPMGEMSSGLQAKSNNSTLGEVTVDDAALFLAKFENGALGTFEATRFAGGNRNKNKFEINGEKGSVRWDMENMNNLEVYFANDEPGLQGFRLINCTEEIHPYAGAYWPSGHIIGYEHTFIHLVHEFLNGIANNYQPEPNFKDGLKNQQVLKAVEESAELKQWVNIAEQ